MLKRLVVFTLLVACVLVAGSSTEARGIAWRTNYVTFRAPVRLPDAVLTPGTYTFEAGPSMMTDLTVVRVLAGRDGRTVMFQGFTTPVTRASRGPMISLGEAPAGAPQPVSVWYVDGGTSGRAFRYR